MPTGIIDRSKEYVRSNVGNSSRMGGFANTYSRTLPRYIDDLTRDLGDDLYERMDKDSQVFSCGQLIKLSAVADGYELRSAIEDDDDPDYDQAAKIADFCEEALDNLSRTYSDVLFEMADGVKLGNKVAEIIYEPGMRGLADIKVKPRNSTSFVVDDFNNVVGLLPYQFAGRHNEDVWTDMLPREKFAVYTYCPTNNDPRGHSIYRPAYNAWNFKCQCYPDYLKFLAQFGGPSLIGTLPENAESYVGDDGIAVSPQKDMGNTLAQYHNGTYAVFAHGADVKTLFAGGTGEAFKTAFALFDHQITKAILLQTLATEEAEFQAKASSEVHRGLLDFVVNHVRQGLGAMTEFDILTPLVRYNFGDEAARKLVPKCLVGGGEKEDWHKDADSIGRLMLSGYLDSGQLAALDERLGLPARSPESLLPEVLPENGQPVGGPVPPSPFSQFGGPGSGPQGGRSRLSSAGKAAVGKAASFVANRYKGLVSRYGKAGAIAVIGGMVALSPLPGSTLATIAIAEVGVRISRAFKKKA